jgi:hypothetical protein
MERFFASLEVYEETPVRSLPVSDVYFPPVEVL